MKMKETDKVWLITGSCGQDASYFFELLLEKGYINIHGTMRRSATFNTQNIDHIFEKLKLHYCDLTDAMNIHNIICKVKPDYIVNFAAQSHVAVSSELENYTLQVNTLGILSILQSVRSNNLEKTCRIYQCGTSEEFGNEIETVLNEDSLKKPVSIYAVSKIAAEHICEIYKSAYNMFIVTGILFNHESPRRGGTFVTKKITNYVKNHNKNSVPLQLGSLNSKRDWSHAKDMCEGIYLMITQKTPINYVLSNDTTHSVREFTELAFKEIGIIIEWRGSGLNEVGINKDTGEILIKVNQKYFRPIDVKILLGDSSRARNELKWSPKFSLNELVKDMIHGN